MNNYNGKNKNFNNKPRMTDEEYAAHKAQLIEKQTKSLDIINDTCTFLEKAIADTNVHRVSMKDVLAYLNGEKNYTANETKAISKTNDILIELANARMNRYIADDRNNIRVLYVHERMKTSFKKELHDRIDQLLKDHPVLLKWSDTTGENYKTVMEEKKDNG